MLVIGQCWFKIPTMCKVVQTQSKMYYHSCHLSYPNHTRGGPTAPLPPRPGRGPPQLDPPPIRLGYHVVLKVSAPMISHDLLMDPKLYMCIFKRNPIHVTSGFQFKNSEDVHLD